MSERFSNEREPRKKKSLIKAGLLAIGLMTAPEAAHADNYTFTQATVNGWGGKAELERQLGHSIKVIPDSPNRKTVIVREKNGSEKDSYVFTRSVVDGWGGKAELERQLGHKITVIPDARNKKLPEYEDKVSRSVVNAWGGKAALERAVGHPITVVEGQ